MFGGSECSAHQAPQCANDNDILALGLHYTLLLDTHAIKVVPEHA